MIQAEGNAPQDRFASLLRLLDRDPQNAMLRRDAVREAFDAGQLDAARKLIDDGLESDPQERGLLALSGFSHLLARRFQESERDLSAAIAHGLDAPGPRFNLAFVIAMQGRFPEAHAILDAPGFVESLPLALVLRARCRHHMQRREEAIADCRAYLATDPAHAECHGLLALLLQETGRNDEAHAHAAVALRADSRQLDALLARAGIQRDAGDFAGARTSFEELVKHNPQSGRGLLGLAISELNDLQLDAARMHAELATRHLTHHVGSWHVLAWIHVVRGDLLAAEHAFRQALAIDRNFAETHGGLASVAAMRGQADEARASARRALKLDPACMSVQCAEVLLLRAQGKLEEARERVEQFVERPVPGSAGTLFRDLVAAHLRHLESRKAQGARPPVLH